jgi:hypothetical protein
VVVSEHGVLPLACSDHGAAAWFLWKIVLAHGQVAGAYVNPTAPVGGRLPGNPAFVGSESMQVARSG